MDEIGRIDDQLRRAFERQAWSGPSLLETLDGVDAARASRRPIAGAHTIWEIVVHVGSWHDIARRRLSGERVTVTPEVDWPPMGDADEGAWQAALERLRRGHAALRETARREDPSRLDELEPESTVSRGVVLAGVAQHDLYHAGQIALLRKA
jgi:uncharacterized damage-inducible protein DinB